MFWLAHGKDSVWAPESAIPTQNPQYSEFASYEPLRDGQARPRGVLSILSILRSTVAIGAIPSGFTAGKVQKELRRAPGFARFFAILPPATLLLTTLLPVPHFPAGAAWSIAVRM